MWRVFCHPITSPIAETNQLLNRKLVPFEMFDKWWDNCKNVGHLLIYSVKISHIKPIYIHELKKKLRCNFPDAKAPSSHAICQSKLERFRPYGFCGPLLRVT